MTQDDVDEEPVRYDSSTPISDLGVLPREPAVSNALRNVRLSRDTKSGTQSTQLYNIHDFHVS